MSTVRSTTKYVYRSSGGGGGNVEMEYGTDLGAFTRLEVRNKKPFVVYDNFTVCTWHLMVFHQQDKIRLLHEDLEQERELRQRVSLSSSRIH